MLSPSKKMTKDIISILFANTKNKTKTAASFTLSIINTVVNLSAPILFAYAVSEFEEDQKQHAQWVTLLLASSYAIAWGIGKNIPHARNSLLHPMATEMSYRLTEEVMRQFYALPMEHRASHTNAPAVQHFGAAYEYIGRTFVTNLLGETIPSAMDLAATTGIIAYYYPIVGSILGGTLLTYVGSILLGARQVGNAQNGYIANLFEAYEYIIGQLDQYENAHYYGNVAYEISNLKIKLMSLNNSYNRSLYMRDSVSVTQTLLATLVFILSSIYAGVQIHEKVYSINDYIWILFYSALFASALGDLSRSANLLYGNYKNYKNLVAYLNLINELDTSDQGNVQLTFNNSNADIEFNMVNFSYAGKPILKNITFKVPNKTTTIIVGSSGQGKSTILRLLQGFYRLNSGSIKIGGQEISTINRKSLREAMAIVPQTPSIFNSSLFHNIRYGFLRASEEEIHQAAIRAGLSDFIDKYGITTETGEKGVKLSGGQKQRVSIARAYLRKQSPILILDEPTSALDPLTERLVLTNLNELITSENKTTLMITHQLNAIHHIEAVHNIIVLDNGTISEQGNLSELLANHGLFSKRMGIARQELALTQEKQEYSNTVEIIETPKGDRSYDLTVN